MMRGQDLLYWVHYVNKFDTGHLLPLYTDQGLVYYYNLDIWVPLFILLFIIVGLCESYLTKNANFLGNALPNAQQV